MKAYLGLGSNTGDSRATILTAVERLKALGLVEAVSSLYRTEPVGLADQPWFLNCAALLETDLAPEALLAACKKIEKNLGREDGVPRNGPRAIDIDILLYGDAVIDTETLTVPHPRMHERRFVLTPLAEIAPEALHPVLGRTAGGLLSGLADGHACERLLH